MNFTLQRCYLEEGTNGTLFYNKEFLGFTIELPWKENKRVISCIPEGVYELKPRYSKKFMHHLFLKEVKDRRLILIHPGNNAKYELQGCIAPVSYLTGVGRGDYSRTVFMKILSLAHQAFDRNEKVTLTIKS